jgi:hypothetical protein
MWHSMLSRGWQFIHALLPSWLRYSSVMVTIKVSEEAHFPNSMVTEKVAALLLPALQSDTTRGSPWTLSLIRECNGRLIHFPHKNVEDWVVNSRPWCSRDGVLLGTYSSSFLDLGDIKNLSLGEAVTLLKEQGSHNLVFGLRDTKGLPKAYLHRDRKGLDPLSILFYSIIFYSSTLHYINYIILYYIIC